MITKIPRFYKWGGGGVKHTWSFGWLAGKDSDLVCVREDAQTETDGELALSPVCTSRLLAFWGFMCKVLLLRIDHNLRVKMSDCGNPRTYGESEWLIKFTVSAQRLRKEILIERARGVGEVKAWQISLADGRVYDKQPGSGGER